MLKPSTHHSKYLIDQKILFSNYLVLNNIPSAHATTKNVLSPNNRRIVTAPSRANDVEYVNYTALDTFR